MMQEVAEESSHYKNSSTGCALYWCGMRQVFIIGLLFLAPITALAAGFTKEPLFLSTSNPVDGETVLIHAIVSNESSVAFAGKLSFTEGAGSVGSIPVSLAVGEAQVFSVSWKPASGDHVIVATLKDTDGSTVGEVTQTFSVSARPTQISTQQTKGGIDSSQLVQEQISNISPAVGNLLSPGFAIVDSVRGNAVDAIDAGVNWAKAEVGTKPPGGILGLQTDKTSTVADTARFVAATFFLYVLSILRWLFASAAIFYPALVVLFFYGLWRMYKRMRRPAWQR